MRSARRERSQSRTSHRRGSEPGLPETGSALSLPYQCRGVDGDRQEAGSSNHDNRPLERMTDKRTGRRGRSNLAEQTEADRPNATETGGSNAATHSDASRDQPKKAEEPSTWGRETESSRVSQKRAGATAQSAVAKEDDETRELRLVGRARELKDKYREKMRQLAKGCLAGGPVDHRKVKHDFDIWSTELNLAISHEIFYIWTGDDKAKSYHRAREVQRRFVEEFSAECNILLEVIRVLIDEKKQPNFSLLSADERWEELERFARRHHGVGLALYGRGLFPDLVEVAPAEAGSRPFPEVAPATWKADKQPGETPPSFVKRIYGEWLGKGFTRATLRHLDPPLARAVDNWLRTNEMPLDIDLPTLKEQNTRWVERMEREGLSAVLPEGSPDFVTREAQRLMVAKHRRSKSK